MRSIFLLFFLISCAHSPKPKLSSAEAIRKIKIEGRGQARLNNAGQETTLSFESLFKGTQAWLLVLEVPFRGEEVIEVDFYHQKITSSFKLSHDPQFDQALSQLLRFMKSIRTLQCDEAFCDFEGERFFFIHQEGSFLIKKSFSKNKNIFIKSSRLTNTFFSKTELFLVSKDQGEKESKADFSLELIWSDVNN